MQYKVTFQACKIGNIQMKNCDIFAQNIFKCGVRGSPLYVNVIMMILKSIGDR